MLIGGGVVTVKLKLEVLVCGYWSVTETIYITDCPLGVLVFAIPVICPLPELYDNPSGNDWLRLYVYPGTPLLAVIGVDGRLVDVPTTNGNELVFFVSVMTLGGGAIIFNWKDP